MGDEIQENEIGRAYSIHERDHNFLQIFCRKAKKNRFRSTKCTREDNTSWYQEVGCASVTSINLAQDMDNVGNEPSSSTKGGEVIN
jgi:hypothetical protein